MQNKTTSQPENKQLSSAAAAWQVARWRAAKPQTGDKMPLQNIVVAVVVVATAVAARSAVAAAVGNAQ